MSASPRIPRAQAVPIARRVMEALQQHCAQFVFAGSLRRLCSTVGDLEVVCIPKPESLLDFTAAVLALGKTLKGSPVGRYCKVEVDGMKLDIFMPRPHDYGRQLAIRTGPADFSTSLAVQWRRLGWVGTEDGLRRMDECIDTGASGWVCKAAAPTLPPKFLTEESFFEFLAWPYPAPKDRI